jgi:hypothetical protein
MKRKLAVIATGLILINQISCERALKEEAIPQAEKALREAAALPTAILASDGSAQSVQAKHDQANDGDTITIPAGNFTWSIKVIITKSITIQGAGKDATTITSALNTNRFELNTVDGKKYRITGIHFVSPTGLQNNMGTIWLKGFSHLIRIDNCKFDVETTWNIIWYDWTLGVVDHCEFYGTSTYIFVGHARWANKTEGDGSYQSAAPYGSAQAVFVEDCILKPPSRHALCDAEPGSRFVIRYCKLFNGDLQNHGNEINGPGITGRACRLEEIYMNEATTPYGGPFAGTRGGSGVLWGNKLTGYANTLGLVYYQTLMHDIGETADGSRKWDINEPGGPFWTGKHTGAAGSTTLVDTTKQWTTNQLIGYSVRNLTKKLSSLILGNTANSINNIAGDIGGKKMTFDPGDDYDIYKLKAGIDMPGMGNDTVMDWRAKGVTPNQPIEPYYIWDNVQGGKPFNTCNPRTATIKTGVHCITGTAKPGYTPFQYPHPLVTGEPVPSPTATTTPTATPIQTPSPIPTATPSPSLSPTPTPTPIPTAIETPSPSPSATTTPMPSPTPTETPAPTPTATPTASSTASPVVPQAPSNLTAQVVKGKNVQLRWKDNSDNETEFVIERSQPANTRGTCLNYTAAVKVARNTVEWTDTSTSKKKFYCYRVKSIRMNESSGWSDVVEISP